ncbi:MAG: PEP-CTERM sorting domain-containing protein [Akkermansia sp.]
METPKELLLENAAAETAFRGQVILNRDVTLKLGSSADNEGTVDLRSLDRLVSQGASLTYGARGEGYLNNFCTQNEFSYEEIETTLSISSTTSSGKLIFGGTTELNADFTIKTQYEAHLQVDALAGAARFTFNGAADGTYGTNSDMSILSMTGYTGTLALQRLRSGAQVKADLWSGANGAALGGLSLDSGAEATVHAQAATSLGSVTMSNSLGLAPRNTLTLQSGGKSISADSIAGVGDVVLCGSGALSVGRAELRSIGGGQAALSSSGYMSMSASGLSGAALSAAELSICGADSTESTLTYTLDRVYMDDGSVLDLSQGSMVTASASVFSSVRMDASSSLTGSALITGDVHLVLSLTELGDIDTTKVVSCDRLHGMVLGAGSTLTLDFSELEHLRSDPQTDGLCVVLEGVQWESGDALFGLAATRSLWEPAAFSCDGTNTYVTFGAVVPEPATATLSLLALAALAARRRRR